MGYCSHYVHRYPLLQLSTRFLIPYRNIFISWQSVCILANGWVIVAELPSYCLRAKSLAIGVCSYAFFTWLYEFIVP